MNFSAPPSEQFLVISELPMECKETDLLMLAQTYGKVKSCELVRDLKNHGMSVSGLVSYFLPECAENAFRAFHGARFMGKILR
jgi:RNA recognition motif-containing protein